jgi:hypothetical protein
MKLHPPVEPDFYLPAVSLEDALECVNFIDPDAARSMWNVDPATGHVSCRYLFASLAGGVGLQIVDLARFMDLAKQVSQEGYQVVVGEFADLSEAGTLEDIEFCIVAARKFTEAFKNLMAGCVVVKNAVAASVDVPCDGTVH